MNHEENLRTKLRKRKITFKYENLRFVKIYDAIETPSIFSNSKAQINN